MQGGYNTYNKVPWGGGGTDRAAAKKIRKVWQASYLGDGSVVGGQQGPSQLVGFLGRPQGSSARLGER